MDKELMKCSQSLKSIHLQIEELAQKITTLPKTSLMESQNSRLKKNINLTLLSNTKTNVLVSIKNFKVKVKIKVFLKNIAHLRIPKISFQIS